MGIAFISRPRGSTALVIASVISIRLPERFQVLSQFRDSEGPPHAAGGNSDLLRGEHEPPQASGAVFERTTTVLQDSAMGQTVLLQCSSLMPSCRATSGSHSAASAQDCVRPGRSSHEGFCETYLIAGAGKAKRILPGRLLPRRAQVCRTRAQNEELDYAADQKGPCPRTRSQKASPSVLP